MGSAEAALSRSGAQEKWGGATIFSFLFSPPEQNSTLMFRSSYLLNELEVNIVDNCQDPPSTVRCKKRDYEKKKKKKLLKAFHVRKQLLL